jgi:hypothetical protein
VEAAFTACGHQMFLPFFVCIVTPETLSSQCTKSVLLARPPLVASKKYRSLQAKPSSCAQLCPAMTALAAESAAIGSQWVELPRHSDPIA